MTQRQLARELGFSAHGFVGFLESGKKMPSAELVFTIAQLFQVSTDVLLNDDLELEPPPEQ